MKKKLLILGAGTAGTIMANRLRKKLPADEWKIAIVDQYPKHYCQPGFLFMPFGIYSEKNVIKPKRKFIPQGVHYIESEIDRIEAERNRVLLRSGKQLDYDLLIIATGVKTAPDAFSISTRSKVLRCCRTHCATGMAANSSCISPRCRSNARSRRWNSRFWQIGG